MTKKTCLYIIIMTRSNLMSIYSALVKAFRSILNVENWRHGVLFDWYGIVAYTKSFLLLEMVFKIFQIYF